MGRKSVFRFALCFLILIISFPIPVLSYSIESPYEWPEANPDDYGFTSTERSSCYSRAEDMTYLRSVLVIKQGHLLSEWYFNDGSRTEAFHIHSASKSFTSALIGIAFREGFLESLDQKLVDFFPEYFTPDMDQRKENITIKHLLTMTAGFDFSEGIEQWTSYANSENWVKHAMELSLLYNPGDVFNYGTVQTNLLSAILTRAAGMSTRDFAEEYLFNPLGISIGHWHQDPQGYYTGGHEMYFVPRDMARLGYLYLNNGSIEGEQIIPSEWVQESLTDYRDADLIWTRGYGFQWWLQYVSGYYTFSARGLGGQYIFCIPELDMVVVTTATGSLFDFNPDQQPAIEQLIGTILQCFGDEHQNSTTSTEGSIPSLVDGSLIEIGIFVAFIGSATIIVSVAYIRKRKMLSNN
jgi:CubicO group peptidase (beta-lactamase class C family)